MLFPTTISSTYYAAWHLAYTNKVIQNKLMNMHDTSNLCPIMYGSSDWGYPCYAFDKVSVVWKLLHWPFAHHLWSDNFRRARTWRILVSFIYIFECKGSTKKRTKPRFWIQGSISKSRRPLQTFLIWLKTDRKWDEGRGRALSWELKGNWGGKLALSILIPSIA